MGRLQDELRLAIANGLTTHTLTSCSRWATHRRIMGEPFPGPYSWKYHPWVKELHDSWAPFTYVMKAAQLGVTEAAINRALYTIDKLKRDVLYVLPTTLNASDFSKSRFGAALDSSPYLKSIFTDTNAVNLKRAGANCLYIRGSRGKSNLKSIPVSELILDEVDEMDQTANLAGFGTIERPVAQARVGHFDADRPGSRHPQALQGLDPRAFHVSLPELWALDRVRVARLRGDRRRTPDRCALQRVVPEVQRVQDAAGAPGEAGVPGRRPVGSDGSQRQPGRSRVPHQSTVQLHGNARRVGRRLLPGIRRRVGGQGVSQQQAGPALYRRWSQSHRRDDRAGDQESHDGRGAARRAAADRLITLGVDQGKISYAVVCEWLFTARPGKDLGAAAICKVLWVGRFMEEDWGFLDQLMVEWQVMYAVVDADPQINEARRFARRFPGFVGLCRYRRGQTAKEVAVSEEDTGGTVSAMNSPAPTPDTVALSAHAIEQYQQRVKPGLDLDAARDELERLRPLGEIATLAPDWVNAARPAPCYLLLGDAIVLPLAPQAAAWIATTCVTQRTLTPTRRSAKSARKASLAARKRAQRRTRH